MRFLVMFFKSLTVWQFILLWLGSIVLTTWIVRQEIALVRWALSDEGPVDCPPGHYAMGVNASGAALGCIRREDWSPVDCGDGQATHFSADGVVTCVDNPIAPAYAVEKLNITNDGSVTTATSTIQHAGRMTFGTSDVREVSKIHPDGTITYGKARR